MGDRFLESLKGVVLGFVNKLDTLCCLIVVPWGSLRRDGQGGGRGLSFLVTLLKESGCLMHRGVELEISS